MRLRMRNFHIFGDSLKNPNFRRGYIYIYMGIYKVHVNIYIYWRNFCKESDIIFHKCFNVSTFS